MLNQVFKPTKSQRFDVERVMLMPENDQNDTDRNNHVVHKIKEDERTEDPAPESNDKDHDKGLHPTISLRS